MNNMVITTDRWLALLSLGIGAFAFGREIGFERWESIISSAILCLILINIFWIKAWLDSQKIKITYEHTKKREKAIKFTKEAESNIHTTHFAKGEADDEYDSAITRKLKNKRFKMIRLIASKRDGDTSVNDWLKKYRVYQNYEEIPPTQKLPFDFTIFDNKKAILYFPKNELSNDFNMCMYIEGIEIVSVFTQLFTRLKTENVLHSSSLKIGTSSTSWLLDAYHVPYLVIEGEHSGDLDELQKWLPNHYSYTNMSSIAKTYWIESERIVLAIKDSSFAICYFISGATDAPTNYKDILSGLRSRLDGHVENLEIIFEKQGVTLKYSKIFLQDPLRYIA